MQKTILGRTGLEVTVAGLGCGGFSRLGIDRGLDRAASIVRKAYDIGVNFFDTAAIYGTQEAMGKGLDGLPRNSYVLSTKFSYRDSHGTAVSPERIMESLEESLRLLRTDYIDIFHIHALSAADYEWAKDVALPVMRRAKEQGKIRFIGVTEQFVTDTSHEMFRLALPEDLFDVVMVGYNILNQSAARDVLPLTTRNNVGVLDMFAVRSALHDPERLKAVIASISEHGQGGAELTTESLDFIIKSGAATSLPEAAYRFCRHAPGVAVTLTGTGNPEHLAENLRAINMSPLPDDVLKSLMELFNDVDCVSGQ